MAGPIGGGYVEPEFRFWVKVAPSESGCWEWQGSKGLTGYGHFLPAQPCKQTTSAHRFSYARFVGPIPPGMCVLHRCDNRSCVRPEHLFLGTQADNVADMIAKGRLQTYVRRTHCKRGHALTPDNLRIQYGQRACKTCINDRQRDKKRLARKAS